MFIFYSHLIIPIAIWLFLSRSFPSLFEFNIMLAITMGFYSVLPDIDTPYSRLGRKTKGAASIINIAAGHRGALHSIFWGVVLSSPLLLISIKYFLAAISGYNLHLLFDLLTKTPIPLFWPQKRKFSLKFFKTGGPGEIIILGLSVLYIVKG